MTTSQVDAMGDLKPGWLFRVALHFGLLCLHVDLPLDAGYP